MKLFSCLYSTTKKVQNLKINLSWKRPDNFSFPYIWHSFEVTTKDGRRQKIQIEDVPSSSYDDLLDFLARDFDPHESMKKVTGVYSDQLIMAETKAFRREILEKKVSLIATAVDIDNRDDSSSKIVGALLLYVISRTDPTVKAFRNHGEIQNVIVRDLEKDINIFTIFNCDNYLEGAGFGVAPEYQGLGIGSQLVLSLLNLGKTFNIFGSVMACSSIGSQTITERLGYQLLNEIKYADRKNEKGEPVLPGIDGSSLKLMFLKFI